MVTLRVLKYCPPAFYLSILAACRRSHIRNRPLITLKLLALLRAQPRRQLRSIVPPLLVRVLARTRQEALFLHTMVDKSLLLWREHLVSLTHFWDDIDGLGLSMAQAIRQDASV